MEPTGPELQYLLFGILSTNALIVVSVSPLLKVMSLAYLKENQMKKRKIGFRKLDGRKQNPPCLDFHINPVFTLGRYTDNRGSAWGIYLEWGYWAIGIAILNLTGNRNVSLTPKLK